MSIDTEFQVIIHVDRTRLAEGSLRAAVGPQEDVRQYVENYLIKQLSPVLAQAVTAVDVVG